MSIPTTLLLFFFLVTSNISVASVAGPGSTVAYDQTSGAHRLVPAQATGFSGGVGTCFAAGDGTGSNYLQECLQDVACEANYAPSVVGAIIGRQTWEYAKHDGFNQDCSLGADGLSCTACSVIVNGPSVDSVRTGPVEQAFQPGGNFVFDQYGAKNWLGQTNHYGCGILMFWMLGFFALHREYIIFLLPIQSASGQDQMKDCALSCGIVVM